MVQKDIKIKILLTSQHSNKPYMGEVGNKTHGKQKKEEKYIKSKKIEVEMKMGDCIMVVE